MNDAPIQLHNVRLEHHIRNNFTHSFYIYSFRDHGRPKQLLFSKNRLKEGDILSYIAEGTPEYARDLPYDVKMKIEDEEKARKITPGIQWHTKLPYDFKEEITNEMAFDIVKKYTSGGWDVDPILLDLFMADFFVVEPGMMSVEVMPYSPHKIIYTNPKTGKTSIAQRVGDYASSASVSNLLGFSTSDSSVSGSLHDQNMPFYIDEVQEEKGKALHNQLLPIMENGITNIRKGKSVVSCHFLGSINWLSNPKDHEHGGELLYKLQNAMETICDNADAFSSRIAFLLFSENIKQAKFNEESWQNGEYEPKYKALREMVTIQYTQLLQEWDISRWLQTPHPEWYVESLDQFIDSVREFPIIRQMGNGLISNYRHARGLALRQTLLSHIGSILRGKLQPQDIIGDAETNYQNILHNQLTSLNTLASFMTPELSEKRYRHWISTESVVNRAVIRAIAEKGEGAIYFSVLDVNVDNRSQAEMIKRVNLKTLTKYGIMGMETENDILFNITNLKKLERILGFDWEGVEK